MPTNSGSPVEQLSKQRVRWRNDYGLMKWIIGSRRHVPNTALGPSTPPRDTAAWQSSLSLLRASGRLN